MTKVLFVCHGNICRSPMAEFILKDMVAKRGWAERFQIDSAATSTEEIGNPVHYGTRAKLEEAGISCRGKYAVQLKKKDYNNYDYIIGMDRWNMKNIIRILHSDPQEKVKLLLEYAESPRDIADPWYTGDFDSTYADIVEGCHAFLEYLERKGEIS